MAWRVKSIESVDSDQSTSSTHSGVTTTDVRATNYSY